MVSIYVRIKLWFQFPSSSSSSRGSQAPFRQSTPPPPASPEVESDPSEGSIGPVASYFAGSPAVLPAPVPQPVLPLVVPAVSASGSASPAASGSTAGSVTPSVARGPPPVPFCEYDRIVQDRDFLLGQNRELMRLSDPSVGSSCSPSFPDQAGRDHST